LKAKSKDKKKIDEIIDEFVKTQSINAKEQLEEFLSDMIVYINRNYNSTDNEALLAIVGSKLKDLNISFDTKELDDIYKKLSQVNSPTTKFEFNKIDLKAIESMRNNFYWVGTEYSSKTQEKLKKTIESAFKGDITREQISSRLKEEFQGVINADVKYFEGVSDHIINQSQNISRVNQALKHDVKHFQVKARIDKKTSDICRSMHNKVIEASHLSNQVDQVVAAKNMSEKKTAAAWSSNPVYGKLPKNFGLPPYHFRCRTEVVPVWLSSEEIDGKKVNFTSKKKSDLITHIDKTGVQRRTNFASLNHSATSSKRNIPNKDIISALNSISEIAPHKDYAHRTVAKSANGYFMVFDADYLYTIFKEPRKNYFKDNANTDKKEIIKWKNTQSQSEMGLLSKIKGVFL